MQVISILLSLLVLAALVGGLLGWWILFQQRALKSRIAQLERILASSERQAGEAYRGTATDSPTRVEDTRTPVAASPPSDDIPISLPDQPAKDPPDLPHPWKRPAWLQHLLSHWMVWLGGLCVSLAGIFMVKYSIDAGLLGPWGRVILALVTGLALHVLAEWLRQRRGHDPSLAALAGAASITLYGALLAALHLYALLDPGIIFVLLALVSLLTMAQALLHGPILAAIGLLGAFVVPLLVSDGSGDIAIPLIYSLIITASGLWLLRRIFRPWLWWGIVAGALGWWMLSMTTPDGDGLRGLYLAALAYAVVAIPRHQWLPWKPRPRPAGMVGGHVSLMGRRWGPQALTLLLITLAWGASIHRQGFDTQALVQWAPLVVILTLAAWRRAELQALPWLSLGIQWLAWLASAMTLNLLADQYQLRGLASDLEIPFLQFAGAMGLLYAGLALLHLKHRGFSHAWMSLALIAPLAWVALGWLLVSRMDPHAGWAMTLLIAGMIYGAVAARRLQRQAGDVIALWFVLAGHLAYALSAAVYFREAGLTLALAAPLLTLAWLRKRYPLPWLEFIIKGILLLVVARLTLNPWVLNYPPDVHWSLWTGGGATLFCALAAWQSRSRPSLQRWLEAGTLHLLVLTLGAEVRYWLHDGDIFIDHYSLTEAAINTTLWATLAMVYWYRAGRDEALAGLYRVCSWVLLALAAGSYALAVTVLNPLWSAEAVSARPIANLLLLAYGAPVLMALWVAWKHAPHARPVALAVAGVGFWLFASLQVRHLWQGDVSLWLSTGPGELYTYSAVWLVMAAAGLLAGSLWRLQGVYRAGMALLTLVIAKLFLVDMAGLDGLWRVASFMGLGLSLLALAWLHRQWLNRTCYPRN
ncbi:DUF2339 domain-containing protein [Ectothiorhodospira variabilis]|uniref:DUF2339 domain-containing protein n=1 Tax=Ectothiorhodospira variabilis TaxID=505694 RepID=UPI001EFAD6E4|nr:DUF2339 domain-containing protein [Ectothiorhodospira variabilis]MCG5498867.1 DUF2339 domain-containing protein [Ectothiorhodospira variabilis]